MILRLALCDGDDTLSAIDRMIGISHLLKIDTVAEIDGLDLVVSKYDYDRGQAENLMLMKRHADMCDAAKGEI